jgi:imidazolonepropionase-like amidohydrolase
MMPLSRMPAVHKLGMALLLLLTLSHGSVAPAQNRSSTAAGTAAIAIEHVTVLPMTGPDAREIPDATVLVRGGRITSISPSTQARVPRGTRRIEAKGKWLMPGLTDMHVHTANDEVARLYLDDPSLPDGTLREQDLFTPYIVNGVLQILDLQSTPGTLRQRQDIESGRVLGPHMALAMMIDGSPPSWPAGMTRVAATAAEGRQAVREAAAAGYDFIKVYSKLNLETFTAIVDEARERHIRVVGHIPERGKGLTEKFFQPGYDLVAHAEEFAQQSDPPALDAIPRYVEMARRNGTWLIATLSLDERILEETTHPESLQSRPELRSLPELIRSQWLQHNPYAARSSPGFIQAVERIIAFNQQLVRAFTAAGIPVLAGTDSLVPGVVPGFALHDELTAMARAGMSNEQVLRSTTQLASMWLRVDKDRGSIEPGKRADLLLLDANPLEDLANTRRIAAVILGGRYIARSELDDMLSSLMQQKSAR